VGRPLVDDLSDEDRRLILEHNRLDAELYSFGRDLFDEAVRSAHGFAADVERLEAMSREVNEEAVRRAQELLDRELPLGTSKAKAELFETARRAGVPAAALKYVSKFGVTKHGEAARRDGEDGNGDGQKIWTRTG
jgi:hypothetical protein